MIHTLLDGLKLLLHARSIHIIVARLSSEHVNLSPNQIVFCVDFVSTNQSLVEPPLHVLQQPSLIHERCPRGVESVCSTVGNLSGSGVLVKESYRLRLVGFSLTSDGIIDLLQFFL